MNATGYINQSEYEPRFWNMARCRSGQDDRLSTGYNTINGTYTLPAAFGKKLEHALSQESLFRGMATVIRAYGSDYTLYAKDTDDLAQFVEEGGLIPVYDGITDKIKAKSKERKTLLTEKKETPVVHVLKHRDLAKRIAEMTEDLEELRSEKAVLLRRMEFPENATADSFRKEIRTLEDGLKKLEASEAKYAAELDNALKQYAEPQAQAAKFDPLELYEARRTIRPEQERQTAQRVQDAYGEKYDLMMMYDSKRHVANLLHEEAEARSIREHLLQKQQRQAQQKQNKKKSRDSWER